jgi:hypothetical protein
MNSSSCVGVNLIVPYSSGSLPTNLPPGVSKRTRYASEATYHGTLPGWLGIAETRSINPHEVLQPEATVVGERAQPGFRKVSGYARQIRRNAPRIRRLVHIAGKRRHRQSSSSADSRRAQTCACSSSVSVTRHSWGSEDQRVENRFLS